MCKLPDLFDTEDLDLFLLLLANLLDNSLILALSGALMCAKFCAEFDNDFMGVLGRE